MRRAHVYVMAIALLLPLSTRLGAQASDVEQFDRSGLPPLPATFVQQQIAELITYHKAGDLADAARIQLKLAQAYDALGDATRAADARRKASSAQPSSPAPAAPSNPAPSTLPPTPSTPPAPAPTPTFPQQQPATSGGPASLVGDWTEPTVLGAIHINADGTYTTRVGGAGRYVVDGTAVIFTGPLSAVNQGHAILNNGQIEFHVAQSDGSRQDFVFTRR